MDQGKIGRFIAQLRHEENLTQEELGQRIGVTNKTISRWENGAYMPDIEMLQILGRELHVSINELISGERLDEAHFREAADGHLVEAFQKNAFSLKEQTLEWKRKWVKDHKLAIGLCVVIGAAVFAGALAASWEWLAGLCPLGWLALYGWGRNRMMIYVEDRLYEKR